MDVLEFWTFDSDYISKAQISDSNSDSDSKAFSFSQFLFNSNSKALSFSWFRYNSDSNPKSKSLQNWFRFRNCNQVSLVPICIIIQFAYKSLKNIVTCQAHPVLVKKANQMCGLFLFNFFCLGSYLAWLLLIVSRVLVLVHLWTDQRITGPVCCWCPGGLLETPPRWHATICYS